MINGINAATPAPNAFPNVDNNDNDAQKKQEEVSNFRPFRLFISPKYFR